MTRIIITLLALLSMFCTEMYSQDSTRKYPANYAKAPRFKALIYYSTKVEEAHQQFAEQALTFFHKLSYGDGFTYEVTQDLSQYDEKRLSEFDIQIWLNSSPSSQKERAAFERYMENGGGWLGFHAAAYNDKTTGWPWFVKFLGGGVFYCNNWPPQPVLVEADTSEHDVTRNLPSHYVMPSSEWYMWDPSPRDNKDIDILLSISPRNYPLGIKDVITEGDFPVVWTSRKYRMVYINAGHGDEMFTDATQNLMYINAFRYVVKNSPKGDPFM